MGLMKQPKELPASEADELAGAIFLNYIRRSMAHWAFGADTRGERA